MEALSGFEPVLFSITLPVFCTVLVSTTSETKSHFKAHFSLSFAEVSQASVSLYFKCALRYFPTATKLSVTVSFSLASSFSGISVYSHYVG